MSRPRSSTRRSVRRSVVTVLATFGFAMAPIAALACTDDFKEEMAMAAERELAATGTLAPANVPEGTMVTDPPTGAFEGVDFIGQLPEAAGATAINFIDYGQQRVMFVTGRFGLKSYDISDPESPQLLDSLDMPGFWQNEDMDVDPKRKLVFMSRDPRAFGQDQATGESGVYLSLIHI